MRLVLLLLASCASAQPLQLSRLETLAPAAPPNEPPAVTVCRLRLTNCPTSERAGAVFFYSSDGKSAVELPVCCP